jgi:hypothetical protein
MPLPVAGPMTVGCSWAPHTPMLASQVSTIYSSEKVASGLVALGVRSVFRVYGYPAEEATARCWAGAFAQAMGHDGEPFGRKMYPVQVLFWDRKALISLLYTYPGRFPTLRVDHGQPMTIPNDADVSRLNPIPTVVEAFRRGKVARIRQHVWPNGSQYIILDLTGFDEAWHALLRVKGR